MIWWQQWLQNWVVQQFFWWFLAPLLVGIVLHFTATWLQRELSYWIGEKAFAYITAPGVIVHELSHAFCCLIFAHKIKELVLFRPSKDGTLGYVKHAWNPRNIWAILGNAWIGTAPVWMGGALVFFLFEHTFTSQLPWQKALQEPIAWLWIYLIFAIGAHARLSLLDIQGAWFSMLIWALIVVGFLYASYSFHWWIENIVHAQKRAVQVLQMPVLVVMSSQVGLAFLLYIFRKIKG